MASRLKVLVAGLGSIGQRHARNLRAICGDDLDLLAYRVRGRSEVLRAAPGSGGTPESVYGIRSFASLPEALAERPDAVIVANPSSEHMAVAAAAADAGCHLFIEKPLADRMDGVDDLRQRVERRGVTALVGYHFRFHPALQLVHRLLQDNTVGRVLSARFIMGEYLPGWHPYEDYRESYAAKRSLGGGALLTQIHELDMAFWFWGAPSRAYAAGGRLSSLGIDVEDVASVLLEYPREHGHFPVHVQMDYVQRPPIRSFDIAGERGRLAVDLLAGTVTLTKTDGSVVVHDRTIDRNEMYVAEMRHFLACVTGRETPLVPIKDGAISLSMALAARRSLETGAPVAIAAAAQPLAAERR